MTRRVWGQFSSFVQPEDEPGYVLAEPQAELASVARAGGRLITREIAKYASDPEHTLPEVERLGGWDGFWATHLDHQYNRPATATDRRDGWRWQAETAAGIGRFAFSGETDRFNPKIRAVLLEDAEAMLDWPIYRRAISRGVPESLLRLRGDD